MTTQQVDPRGVPAPETPGIQEVQGEDIISNPVKPLFKKDIVEDKIIETTAPVKRALVKEYMKDKEITFLLKYKDLRMKGKTLITYLCNAGLPIELVLEEKEDIHEIMESYFKSKNITGTESLALIGAAMVLQSRGVEYEHVFNFPFSKDVVTDFVDKHSEIFERVNLFLDSLPLYLMSISQEMLGSVDEHPGDIFKNIDDEKYIGANIVNILQVPGFLDIVFSTFQKEQEMFYFTKQFEKYMFKGLNLFAYLAEANSSVLHFYQGLCTGQVTEDQLKQIQTYKEEE